MPGTGSVAYRHYLIRPPEEVTISLKRGALSLASLHRGENADSDTCPGSPGEWVTGLVSNLGLTLKSMLFKKLDDLTWVPLATPRVNADAFLQAWEFLGFSQDPFAF